MSWPPYWLLWRYWRYGPGAVGPPSSPARVLLRWLAGKLRPHLFPALESLMSTLRDDLNAMTASTSVLKVANDAAAAASSALASAQVDTAAKVSTFSAHLRAAGGKAGETTPNADGTLTLYVSDASAQGHHVEVITTLDAVVPEPTPAPAPEPVPAPEPAPVPAA